VSVPAVNRTRYYCNVHGIRVREGPAMVCFYCGGANPDDELCTCSIPQRTYNPTLLGVLRRRENDSVRVERVVACLELGLYPRVGSRNWRQGK
jgi:hypothetical protein